MRSKSLIKGSTTPKQLEIHNKEQYLTKLQKDFAKKAMRPAKRPPPEDQIKTMIITAQAYDDMENCIGSRPAESGGILLSNESDYIITCFIFDSLAAKNPTIYQPNTEFLNSVLKGRNDEFVGIAHSHPRGARQLTSQDQRAAWSNLTSPGNPHLNAYLMPLIQTIPDTGRFEIIPYIVTCHPEGKGRVIVKKVNLEIIG
jgi:hypothetical protein